MINSIESREDLARNLDIKYSELKYILFVRGPENYYKTFDIPKKSGEKRHIKASYGDLKKIQKKLSDELSIYQQHILKEKNIKTNISHAFEKGKSIISNAGAHKNKRIVVNLDLKDFFDSFHIGRIIGFFEKNNNYKLPHEVAVAIAQITCYKGVLPQGAPSSPIITNLICQIMDMALIRVARKYHLNYTRYADDLTFSTNDKRFLDSWNLFFKDVSNTICRAGFKINEKKIRIQYRDSRQTVTGLVVNKKISVPRTYYKKVRAMAYSLYSTGTYHSAGIKGTMQQLEGRFAFINQIDKNNNEGDKENKYNFYNLNAREKQYRQFLFYKYFFANEKPIIVTEGKTDIKYIKAALKNLYSDYPTLIEKSENGKFSFKVSFLRRTKRISELFGISQDGADAMKNLYDYFCDKGGDRIPNYLKWFCQKTNRKPDNPVLLLFDNEMIDKDKPLIKFINHLNMSEEEKKHFAQRRYARIVDKMKQGNLYLVTNPLIGEKTECEIEDLFDENVKGHIIDNKRLSLKPKYDSSEYYGKETFANYIKDNYKHIDFENFRPLLDSLKSAIDDYNAE